MRSFNGNLESVFNSDRIEYFFLIKLSFSQDFYFTSYHSDIAWDGQTWVADGGLLEVDSPRFSSVVDREAYKIVLTDLVDQLAGEFKAGVIGSDIQVWAGFTDPSTGQPMLASGDVVSIYSGYVDSPAIENDWETKTAVIEGSSPMADLDRVNLIMVSKDGMDQLNLSDTSYDRIYDDAEISLKWGKV